MKNKKNILNETVIDGCKVYIEDGEVKTVLNEQIEKEGFMELETARALLHETINKIYNMDNGNEIPNR